MPSKKVSKVAKSEGKSANLFQSRNTSQKKVELLGQVLESNQEKQQQQPAPSVSTSKPPQQHLSENTHRYNFRSRNQPSVSEVKKTLQKTKSKVTKASIVPVPTVPVSPVPFLPPAGFLLPSVEANYSLHFPLGSRLAFGSSTSDASGGLELPGPGLSFSWNDHEASLVKFALRHPEMCAKVLKERTELAFQLKTRRNVNFKPSKDDFDFIGLESQLEDEAQSSKTYSEHLDALWRSDRDRCMAENEAIFQRTLMMSMVDRHRFFPSEDNDEENCFDFSVEQKWKCPPMPIKGIELGIPETLSSPQPDLCVCFRTEAVLNKACRTGLSKAMYKMINFEGSSQDRAFPFLAMETKNGSKPDFDKQALGQCLNMASQALHIQYEFFREAKLEKCFFDNVRFFTVAATATGCKVLMHRAVDGGVYSESKITSDYRLEFEYQIIGTFREGQYTRQIIVDLFEKIIWGYGIELRTMLRIACARLSTIMRNKDNKEILLKRTEEYYRHGQASKASISQKSSRAASQASSRNSVPQGDLPPTPPTVFQDVSITLHDLAEATRQAISAEGLPEDEMERYRDDVVDSIDAGDMSLEIHDTPHSSFRLGSRNVNRGRNIRLSTTSSRTASPPANQRNSPRKTKRQRR